MRPSTADAATVRGEASQSFPGPAADARAAAGADHADARALEDLVVALALRVALHVLGPVLEEEVHALGDAAPGGEGLAHHARVHVEVVALARGAGAAVGDVD